MPILPPPSGGKQDADDSHGMAKARRRIEKARREGSLVLDLSWLGLTSVPEALGQLTALQTLSISNNRLTSVPEAIVPNRAAIA